VRGHRAREGVLGVGVDVHLHHAVVDGRGDLLRRRAGAAVEDQVERLRAGLQAELADDRVLGLLEDLGAQLDVARLVDAVHVAEGQRGHVVPAVAVPERLRRRDRVGGGRVELLVDGVLDAVLLAADHADLDLEDDPGLDAAVEQLLGDLQVLVQGNGGAVPHVRLEQRLLAAADALLGDREQRPHEAVELVLRAVVGVQRDVHGIALGHLGGVRRERDRPADHVLHRRHLDDAVRPGVREALQRRVQGLRGRHVDGREGVLAGLGGVEHLGVLLGSHDGHAPTLLA